MADTPTVNAAPAAAPEQATTVAATTAPKQPQAHEVLERKERQLRKMQQELQQQRAALEAKAKSYETDYMPKSRLKEDPWSVLEEAGLDYDTLTQQLLSRPNDPVTKSLQAKLRAMEQRIQQDETAKQQAVQQQYEVAKKQITNEAKLLVDSDPAFETVKASGAIDAVVDLIEETFNRDGILLDVKDAAQQVEDYLINEAIKLAGLSKVKAKLAPQAPPVEEKPAAAPVVPTRQKNTLTITNRMQATTPSKASEKDRIARAMAAFKGEKIS